MQIEILAAKIAVRDKEAFEELYREMSRIIYSVCLGIVRNRGIAEEMVQDTFVSVWENICSYGGKGFKTWIITIARNKSLNAIRREKHEIAVDFTENEGIGGGYLIGEQVDEQSVLDTALRILPDDEREIVLMRNSGMKAKEIAAALGIPRGTVSWKYSEAIGRLKGFLEGES